MENLKLGKTYFCFHIIKQNVIAIYCLVVFAEEDNAEEDDLVEVEGLILKL